MHKQSSDEIPLTPGMEDLGVGHMGRVGAEGAGLIVYVKIFGKYVTLSLFAPVFTM